MTKMGPGAIVKVFVWRGIGDLVKAVWCQRNCVFIELKVRMFELRQDEKKEADVLDGK